MKACTNSSIPTKDVGRRIKILKSHAKQKQKNKLINCQIITHSIKTNNCHK